VELLKVYPQLEFLSQRADGPGLKISAKGSYFAPLGNLPGAWTILPPGTLEPQHAALARRFGADPSEPLSARRDVYLVGADNQLLNSLSFLGGTLAQWAADPGRIPNPDSIGWVVVITYEGRWPKATKKEPVGYPRHTTEVAMLENTGQLQRWRDEANRAAQAALRPRRAPRRHPL
jgi:hypothetical protein